MLIGDDRVAIRREGERILRERRAGVQGLIERRGYGIVADAGGTLRGRPVVVDLSAATRTKRAIARSRQALLTTLAGVALPRLIFGGESGPLERACALLGRLDKTGDKIMTAVAHFA